MSKAISLVLLLLFFTESGLVSATDNIYIFEGDPLTICPLVFFSQAAPSFLLQPLSTKIGFLTGNYSYSGNRRTDFKFLVDIKRCEARRPSTISDENCSVLSVIYKAMDSVAVQGTLEITYTSSGGDTQIITVDYGSRGLYISPPNQILRRQLGSMSDLDGSVIAYGQALPAVLCINGSGQRLSANFIPTSTVVGSCSRNVVQEDATNVDPVLFRIVIDQNIMGRYTVYAAAGSNCSNEIRSPPFEILLDPVTPPEDSTTTEHIEPTPSPPTTRQVEGIIIGVGVSVGAVVSVVMLIVIGISIWCYKKNRQKTKFNIEKGSTVSGTRSKTSSVSTVDGPEVPSGSPTFLISSNTSNGHVQRQMLTPRRQTKRKLFVVKYKESKAIGTIEETLAELNEDLYELATTQENGFLPLYMSNIIDAGHRVVVLHGCKESASQSDDIASRWIKELDSPKFTSKRLDNVFVVYLGCTQPPAALQTISRLQRISISEHPDDEDSNFDASSIAKKIQEEIINLSPIIRQPVATESANPSPLVTRNPVAGADQAASPAEPSPPSLTNENKPDKTGQAEAPDTSAAMTAAKKFLDKTHSELKAVSSTASTPAAARSRDGDDLTSSSSVPSVIQVGKDDLKLILQAVKDEGDKTRKKIMTEGQEIREKVDEKGDEIEEGVKKEGAQTRAKVEEGDKLLEGAASDTVKRSKPILGRAAEIIPDVIQSRDVNTNRVNSTASTPATARSQDGDDLTSSPSAPSVIQVGKDDLKLILQAVKDEGDKTRKKIMMEGQETRETVEKEGEEIRSKVDVKGDEIEERVERKGDEIEKGVKKEGAQTRAKVEEEGDKLLESIEFVADATEQTRKELEDQNLKVEQPYDDDDDDDGGKESSELGHAPTREDSP